MARKSGVDISKRSVSPAAAPPSSTTAYKTQSSATSSQSHTTSTSTSKGGTAVPAGSSSTTASTASSSTPQKSTTASSKGATARTKQQPQNAQEIVTTVWQRYLDETPQRVKIIDAFMGFLVLLGVVQFVYVVLAGNYPFNAFLAGFSATVGQFVLTASLRIQTNPENKKGNFEKISDERAFADFVLGSLILHLFCVNFIN